MAAACRKLAERRLQPVAADSDCSGSRIIVALTRGRRHGAPERFNAFDLLRILNSGRTCAPVMCIPEYVACLSVVMLVDNQRPAFLLMSASTANEGPVFLMTSPSKANDGPFSWLSFFSGQGGCF